MRGNGNFPMGNTKKGFIQPRVPLEIGGLVYRHLLPYARSRNMAPAEAINAILGDWAEGREGIRNPFAGTIPVLSQTAGAYTPEDEDLEEDDEELAAQQQIEDRIAKTASM